MILPVLIAASLLTIPQTSITYHKHEVHQKNIVSALTLLMKRSYPSFLDEVPVYTNFSVDENPVQLHNSELFCKIQDCSTSSLWVTTVSDKMFYNLIKANIRINEIKYAGDNSVDFSAPYAGSNTSLGIAINKMLALQKLGFSPRSLRLAFAKETNQAFLIVHTQNGPQALTATSDKFINPHTLDLEYIQNPHDPSTFLKIN